MSGRGHQLIHSDALSAELEALGLDSSLFGAAGIPAPIFQALVPRRAGVFDEHANTFGTGDEPASFTRASLGLYRNADGAWASAAANAIRPDHDASGAFLGYLFEPASTNDFLNSDAAATQDIALGTGTFTCSVHGAGSVTSSDGTGTASGHGAATDGSPNTIVVSGAGTITYTVSGSPTYVQVEELPVPTSPIITAGASETRAVDALSWAAVPAGFSHAAGLVLCDYRPRHTVTSMSGSVGLCTLADHAIGILYVGKSGSDGQLKSYDSVNALTQNFDGGSGPAVAETLYRCASRWNAAAGEKQLGIKNGSWSFSAPGPYDGIMDYLTAPDRLAVAHSVKLPICLARVMLFNRDISAAEIARLF